jgi:AraC-like DNA-binding protein
MVLDELRVDGLRVISALHPAGLAIHAHAHDLPKLVVLVHGGATERIGPDLIEHRAFELVARARFRTHENQYHARGARSVIVELGDRSGYDGQLTPDAARLHGRRLIAAFRGPRRERARLVRGAVADAILALGAAAPPRTPAWLERARELLLAQIASPPGIVELARTVGVHPVHLAQTFRRRWNATPMGYVRAHRVFRAVELIERGVALARVAAEVGFADQSHMTRTIQRVRQAPPGALRRTMRGGPSAVQDRSHDRR